MTIAKGAFEVTRTAMPAGNLQADKVAGRWLLDKRFHGELSATSLGQMLAIGTEANGSGVYVAVERVSGTLAGREGSFVLHHVGNASKTGQTLALAVAANSGTGGLQGLTGTMDIIIEPDGSHFYSFDYRLPD